MRRYSNAMFPQWMGIEITSLEPGRAVVALQVQEHHLQYHKVLHGGAAAALADTAVAFAVLSLITNEQDTTTIELKLNYLRPIAAGRITADARIIRLGKTIAVGEADIYDEQHQLSAKAIATYMVFDAAEKNSRTAQAPQQ